MSNLVGTRLKKARRHKNLTQIQVMKHTGINHKTLSGYENGVSKPDLESLTILGKFYEISTDYLLGLNDNPRTINLANLTEYLEDNMTSEDIAAMQAVLRCLIKHAQANQNR